MANPNVQPTYDVTAADLTFTMMPDRLIGGDGDFLTKSGTLNAGTLQRGSVLGKITANGNYALAAAASNDGSQTPNVVLALDADASGGPVPCVVIVEGQLNAAACTFGTGITEATAYDPLRQVGIYLIDVEPTSP